MYISIKVDKHKSTYINMYYMSTESMLGVGGTKHSMHYSKVIMQSKNFAIHSKVKLQGEDLTKYLIKYHIIPCDTIFTSLIIEVIASL